MGRSIYLVLMCNLVPGKGKYMATVYRTMKYVTELLLSRIPCSLELKTATCHSE